MSNVWAGYAILPNNATHEKASNGAKVRDDDNIFTRVELPLYSPVHVELPANFNMEELNNAILSKAQNSMAEWFDDQDSHVRKLIVAHQARIYPKLYSTYFNVPNIAQHQLTNDNIKALEDTFWARFEETGAWDGIFTEQEAGQRLAFFITIQCAPYFL